MQVAGDLLYNMIGSGIGLIVGFTLIMKAGNKLGWVLVAGALVYGWLALQPTIKSASTRNAAPEKGGYYKTK